MHDTDKRWKEFGEVIAGYCLDVQSGDKVMIAMHEVETFSLSLATYEAVIKLGGYPQVQMKSELLRRAFMKYGNENQYSWVPEIEIAGMKWADKYAGLRGAYNLDVFHDIPAKVLAKNQSVHGKVSTARWENTRWVITRVPNSSFAQQAGLDLETVTDMYFNSCLMDYKKLTKKWNSWANKLKKANKVHILGKKTDLKFSVEGCKWDVDGGLANIPGGEIFTTPINKTLNGYIYWENPGVLGGRFIHEMYVEWKDGRMVKASSSTNEDYLQMVLSTDEGASLLGEFAFGVNKGLTHFTNDIFWDEKIYGTIHIAFGRAYTGYGSDNKSAIHWDVVKDMRKEGKVFIDDMCIMNEGELLLDSI